MDIKCDTCEYQVLYITLNLHEWTLERAFYQIVLRVVVVIVKSSTD